MHMVMLKLANTAFRFLHSSSPLFIIIIIACSLFLRFWFFFFNYY